VAASDRILLTPVGADWSRPTNNAARILQLAFEHSRLSGKLAERQSTALTLSQQRSHLLATIHGADRRRRLARVQACVP
jgi:hypothetical protein